MALCVSILSQNGVNYVVSTGASDSSSCGGSVLLSAAEYNDFLSQLTAFGFDSSLFEKAFSAGLVLYLIGLSIGFVISIIRKARTP